MSAISKIQKLKFSVAVFVALVAYVVALLLLFEPGMMVNDDVAMMAFANGDFTGQPESRLVFMGALVGFVLKLLYTMNADLPWYPLFMTFVNVIASTLLVVTFYRVGGNRKSNEFVGVTALVLAILPSLVLDISFSTTAMYGSVAGLLALFMTLSREQRKLSAIALGSILVVMISSSIRAGFFVSATLILVPTILYSMKNQRVLRALLSAGLIFGGVLTLSLSETQIAKSGEWSDYVQFNRLRGSLHGTSPLAEKTLSILESGSTEELREFGWNLEDLLLFGGWYFEDRDVFNIESLRGLREIVFERPDYYSFEESLEGIVNGREFILLAGIFLVVLVVRTLRTHSRNLYLAQAFWFTILSLYIASRHRYPDRFALGAFFGLFAAILALSVLHHSENNDGESEDHVPRETVPRNSFSVALIAAAIICGVLIPHKFSATEVSTLNIEQKEQLGKETSRYARFGPDASFVYIGILITSEGFNPWTERTVLNGDRVLGLGWPTFSPHQEKRKLNMSLDGDFIGSMLDDKDKYVVSTKEMTALLTKSYLDRRRVKIRFDLVAKFEGANVYRVRRDQG